MWTATFNGQDNDTDQALAIALDSFGNVYVTGVSGQYSDYVTIKYDTNGSQIWLARHIPGIQPYAIAVGHSGKIYVTGRGTGISSAVFDTVAYDPNGNFLWEATYDGPGPENDLAKAIDLDGDENVYITGDSSGLGTGQDLATIKYDSDGNELWIARYHGSGPAGSSDSANDIAIDTLGNVYVTGFIEITGNDASARDYVTIKYDTDGNQLWKSVYNGPGDAIDSASSLDLDLVGNVYVTGLITGIETGADCATVKYDSDGNQIWVSRFNGSGNGRDSARQVRMDSNGNVYVAGISEGNGTAYDAIVIKYTQDSDGDGVLDGDDNCPSVPNPSQDNFDGDAFGDACDPDDDNDDILDESDNCPFVSNSDQLDTDHDGIGDVCDPDDDNDGVLDANDNCPTLTNADQLDTDGDGSGNVCDSDDDNDGVADTGDNCPLVANTDQKDFDGDSLGDLCDPDDDNDNVLNSPDQCRLENALGQDANQDGCIDRTDHCSSITSQYPLINHGGNSAFCVLIANAKKNAAKDLKSACPLSEAAKGIALNLGGMNASVLYEYVRNVSRAYGCSL